MSDDNHTAAIGVVDVTMSATVTSRDTGHPRVYARGEGRLQIMVAGVTLFMDIDSWRELNHVVEQAITSAVAV